MSRQSAPAFQFHVVGYQDQDGNWLAHCLETDLIGCGDSFEKAFQELRESTELQINFAHFKNKPNLIYHPAPPWVFQLWHQEQIKFFSNLFSAPPKKKDTTVGEFPIMVPEKPSDFAVASV